MTMWIFALICTAFLYSTAQGYSCSTDNLCELGGYYSSQNQYGCSDQSDGSVKCTCPGGGSEINRPCRPCNRSDPFLNACKSSSKLYACIETDQFGTAYVCFCYDSAGNVLPTTDGNCDTTITVTPRPTTTTTTAGSIGQCFNGGAYVNGLCQCPSGFGGPNCAEKFDTQLCDRVNCKNNGTCVIRSPTGVAVSVCLCHYGTFGDYCELIGTLGYCSSGLCLNGGACRENVVGATRHAYCYCAAGYSGSRCETQYFTCPSAGKFTDYQMDNQGGYFECTNVGGILRATQKSCARGLYFNQRSQSCGY